MTERLFDLDLHVFPIIREIQRAIGVPKFSFFLSGLEDRNFLNFMFSL